MTDLTALDLKMRRWLKRVPLSAIVVLLEAVHAELESRTAALSELRQAASDHEHALSAIGLSKARNGARLDA